MKNKPVAYRHLHEDGWEYYDAPTGEDCKGCIPLYTHQYERPHNTVLVPCDKLAEMQAEIEALKANPVKELNNGGEPVKNATYWKRQYNLMASQNDNLKSALYHANEQIKYLESHPIKELTDEEITEIAKDCGYANAYHYNIRFARAILRKAQKK